MQTSLTLQWAGGDSHEAQNWPSAARPTPRRSCTISRITTPSPEDAARAAKEAGVSTLVLYHLVPPLPSKLIEPMFLGNAPSIFRGQLLVGKDGMIISLPPGGKAVNVSSAW